MIFIRPWLLLLVLVPFVWRLTTRYHTQATTWTKWVDKKLLPYLLVSKQASNQKQKYWHLTLLWSLFVFAAAGPAFQKLPVPISQDLPNTVIIFDLGPAMQGSNLATAKIKLHDLLTALKGNRVGLVLYANKGYTALPLTQDRAMLRALIPTLDPSVLPNTQQNLSSAFQQANELIQQTGGKGRILYLTAGGVEAKNIHTSHPVGILGLDDKAIPTSIKKLGIYHAKTTDASDILSLLNATQPNTNAQLDQQEQTDEWADLAGIIALILLPFFALTFRKGILFVLLMTIYLPAQASFFKRPDQEEYIKHEQAVQAFRLGNYEQAINGFQNHPYNQGNALAYAGQIQQAIQAYDKALKLDPNDEDARFNKEYLEKQLPPPESSQQNEQQQNQQQTSSDNEEQEKQQESDNSSQENEEDKTNENQQTDLNTDTSPQEDSSANDKEQFQPQESDTNQQQQQPQEVNEADKEQQPFNQEEQQLLNRLRTDPYRVLRYRLLQQERKK